MRAQHALSVMNRTVEQQRSLDIVNYGYPKTANTFFIVLSEKKFLSGN